MMQWRYSPHTDEVQFMNFKFQNHIAVYCNTYGISIESICYRMWIYSISEVYVLNMFNPLSVNSTPDGTTGETMTNITFNASSIRNVMAQIWQRTASIVALCLLWKRDIRAVIKDVFETLVEARGEPQGFAVSGNRCATHSQQLYPTHNALVGDSGQVVDWRWYLT